MRGHRKNECDFRKVPWLKTFFKNVDFPGFLEPVAGTLTPLAHCMENLPQEWIDHTRGQLYGKGPNGICDSGDWRLWD